MFSLPVLEHQLVMYVTAEGRDTFASPFDLSKIPVVTREQADADERTRYALLNNASQTGSNLFGRKLTSATPTLKAPSAGPKPAAKGGAEAAALVAAAAQKYASELQKIPELSSYGGVLKSSPVVELTESETEYVVKAIKHIFKEHIVLQFVCILSSSEICILTLVGYQQHTPRHCSHRCICIINPSECGRPR
jgi:coatomer protein complex subunit gamma